MFLWGLRGSREGFWVSEASLAGHRAGGCDGSRASGGPLDIFATQNSSVLLAGHELYHFRDNEAP